MNQDSLLLVAGLLAAVLVWNVFISINQAADSASLSNLELESCAARHSAAVDSVGKVIQQVALSSDLELATHYSVDSVTYPCTGNVMENAKISIKLESEASCLQKAPSPNCFSITLFTQSFSLKRFYSLGDASFSSLSECTDKTGHYPVGVQGFGFGDFLFSNSSEKICIYRIK